MRGAMRWSTVAALLLLSASVALAHDDGDTPSNPSNPTSHDDHDHGGGGAHVGVSVDITSLFNLLDKPSSPPPSPPSPPPPPDAVDNLPSFPVSPFTPDIGKRPGSGVPLDGVAYRNHEVIVELDRGTMSQVLKDFEDRHHLTERDQLRSRLTATLLVLETFSPESVTEKIRELEADPSVLSAQPNYLYALEDAKAGDAQAMPQYGPDKLHLAQAHTLATGENVLVAMIDSGVDPDHPEIKGTIAWSYNAIGTKVSAHSHGTAIAGLIAAHAKLTGAAPAAHILAVRAFDASTDGAQGTTFNILKGLDWSAVKGARVINMSFAGPADPDMHRSLAGAHLNNIVLVAAAGNAGPNAAPLFPAADPSVVAVTATDEMDHLYSGSNRGNYIGVAAPGVDLLVASPNNGYELSTGTSLSAAEVSGVAALMLVTRHDLTPDGVRARLVATGHAVDPAVKLADAYAAVAPDVVPPAAAPIVAATKPVKVAKKVVKRRKKKN
jgi:subtilisin family serine protease